MANNRSKEGISGGGADKENKKRSSGSSSSSKKKKSRHRSRSRSHSHGRRSRSRSRSRGERDRRDRHGRDRSRERRRSSPSRERAHSSHSHSSHRRTSRERRHRSPERVGHSSFRSRRSFSKSPLRVGPEELTAEERDARTIFCMQLSQRVRPRDLEEFFSSVGKVKDVRLIMDNKTRRSKGICYVEFASVESVALALGLNNQKLLGVPIIVQPTQAEKNRVASNTITPATLQKGTLGPLRLYVGSLHFNITEEMLKGIFEPFGKIDHIELTRDPENGRSKGYGFITFHDSEDAKKALEQLNGFELAGRPMKVGHVTERAELMSQGPSFLDSDELDRSGIDLGATGRLQLMAKLAEGTGFQLPQAAVTALQMTPGGLPGHTPAPPIATQCFMLSNMFDINTDTAANWAEDIRNDVIEECNKHGGALHVYVDRGSPHGNVYVKCPSISSAVASVNSLHGRWFAGRVITAAYVPVVNYHSLFAEAATALTPIVQ